MSQTAEPETVGSQVDHDDFLRRWHAFARRWHRTDRHERAALVETALQDGLPAPGKRGDSPPPSEEVLHRCAAAVIAASGAFDAEGYAAARSNRVVLRGGVDPLTQFVTMGWRELRGPSLDFDLWWYWCEYLDPTREDVNPLLHFVLEGRRRGYRPVPGHPPGREHARLPADRPVRRICLFAGYDRDGVIDDYVVAYLRELSRFADVYYLADGVLDPGELDRLDGVVVDAWSIPHAAYDFGSYSMLARDLVGWERIASYDELVLANDSCFLLRPLDATLAEMNTRTCDWWGLQATSMEFNEDDLDDPEAVMPLPAAKAAFVGPRRWSDVLYLHLSSYFLVFRRPVIDDEGFRRRLDSVRGQRDKMSVVHKYEVGLSRYLMDSGFDFDTLITDLLPFHPLYSRRFFDLAAAGFPLVKRNFLAENPRDVPGFAQWPEWLAAAVPEAPLAAITANIARVSPDDLHQVSTLATANPRTGRRRPPPRPLVGYGFRTMSRELPKHDHWWAFPVSPDTHRLTPGQRAVFEAVRDDPTVRKVVLTRSRRVDLDGENVAVLPMSTREGQSALVRCGQVLIDGSPSSFVEAPMPAAWHRFIHVGSGLPTSPPPAVDVVLEGDNRLAARAVASRAEALARAADGSGLGLVDHWLTGLARHDLVVCKDLPDDLAREEASLRDRLDGRRLAVFWPRRDSPGPSLQPSELDRVGAWARRHDVVLGVRDDRVDRSGSWTQALGPRLGVTVSSRSLEHAAAVLRSADVVITDGADEAVDFLLTGRPLLYLLPEPAAPADDATVTACYPPERYLPGPVCYSFDALEAALDGAFEQPAAAAREKYESALRLAFEHRDDRNAWRLAWRIRGHVDAPVQPSGSESHSAIGK